VNKEPKNVKEALRSEDAKKWKITMLEEYNSLVINNTLTLMSLPKGRKHVSCK
jgi:hypothetical protein